MGDYFNPENESFLQVVSGKFYVDKTGLIKYTNAQIGTPSNCIAVSHARRFGKTQVARMLKAYYSRGCDSGTLFSKFKIASYVDFSKHLNKYNVIYIDMQVFLETYKEKFITNMISDICDEMKEEYTSINYNQPFFKILSNIKKKSGVQFVIIIDEWDCVIRQYSNNTNLVHNYLQFLHSIFKSELSSSFLALAYITGILPIKKIEDESALNNFNEFTMINSRNLTKYFGFTKCEVFYLCNKYNINFEYIEDWYDGYLINGIHIYNPNSIYYVIINNQIQSYWKNTSSFESINSYIKYDYSGLKKDLLLMIGGQKVDVNVNNFTNDLSKISSKDDVLTALIHLGYLGYDAGEGAKKMGIYGGKTGKAFIPNTETGEALSAALQRSNWKEFEALSMSYELLEATIQKNANKVAEILTLAHDAYSSVLAYNSELALSCTISMAYFAALAEYNIVRELPAGTGYADIAFIPLERNPNRPAMIVELKYKKSTETAIKQIKEHRYAGALKGYSKEIILVGIDYSLKRKKHQCIIESINL